MQTNRPLVVDLDGTLLCSDLLLESAFAFLRDNPLRLFSLFFWLLGGKSNLKARLAAVVPIDVATLPYDKVVLSFLEQERAKGRELILATASHETYAHAIAAHLGLFARVLATRRDVNLSGQAKRDILVREFGDKEFDYLGNSRADLKVWVVAHKAYVANPEFGVAAAAARLGNLQQVIHTPTQSGRTWIKQLRLHQWAKNVLLFVPLLASHRIGEGELFLNGILAFVLFGLCASSVYLLNDLFDLEDDRQHPSKRFRPLAAGAVPIKTVLLVFPVLLLTAFGGAAWLLPWKFSLTLAFYYALTLAYTMLLKRIMAFDVIVLAMLYTVRIIAGAFAFNLNPTFWMLAFSMFLFLSLALVKRYADLRDSQNKAATRSTSRKVYGPADLDMISSLGASSGYLSVMVMAFYIQDQGTRVLYDHPEMIWLACPILLYWVTRIWMITHRGWMHEDPVVFTLKDRTSLLIGVLFGMVFWLAT